MFWTIFLFSGNFRWSAVKWFAAAKFAHNDLWVPLFVINTAQVPKTNKTTLYLWHQCMFMLESFLGMFIRLGGINLPPHKTGSVEYMLKYCVFALTNPYLINNFFNYVLGYNRFLAWIFLIPILLNVWNKVSVFSIWFGWLQ